MMNRKCIVLNNTWTKKLSSKWNKLSYRTNARSFPPPVHVTVPNVGASARYAKLFLERWSIIWFLQPV